ncbi:transporter [Vibrio astriarenae]|uniref:Transporter n=1 Tax=Vibrio astriarenae TaxID=1481923 RepID=A0A7Z2T4A7_9VIBR|nr:transporter [Vibrio astriarenae]QIA64032.1 transporter [Vibrio astriarenae]
MTNLDWSVLALYFVFLLIVTVAFKRHATSADGFIKGNGAMTWWMAGATAFMTQFSAWTFTGAAAKAFEDGLSIMFVFWGNALGFFVSALYFAKRYRRLRVATAMDVIRIRFDKMSEQVFTWSSFPITLVGAAIWLNGLGAFLSATFGISIDITIISITALVTFIALSGGVWTVSATNVIQLVLLVTITVVVGFTAAQHIVTLPVESVPEVIMGDDIAVWQIFVLWAGVMMLKQTLNTNNALSSYRFLITSNEKEATRSAMLAGVLFLIAPLLWFSPPWFVASMGIDLAQAYPGLGAGANNGAYLYYIEHYMPQGLLGLVMVAMLAATVSPMTTALNRNAGIVVNNIYLSLINPKASDEQQMLWGKVSTLATGILAGIVALLFARIEGYSLFDIMMIFTALLQMPLSVPSFLALMSLRTPAWSGWATVCVGLVVSAFMHFIFDVVWLEPLTGALNSREQIDLIIVATLLAHIFITGGFFIATQWLGDAKPINNEVSERINTPMSVQDQTPIDHSNGIFMGKAMTALGVIVALFAVTTDNLSDAGIFIGIGFAILLCGFALASMSNRLHKLTLAESV